MRNVNIVVIAGLIVLFAGCVPFSQMNKDGWTLVWSDEFDTAGLPDAAKWNYDTGGHGWGNGERQFYTEKDMSTARVENGKLVIEASYHPLQKGESLSDWKKYTSARLVTYGRQEMHYGRIEVRAKLPRGRGIWPAIWMLPTAENYGTWPRSGEIDIMELVGWDPDMVHFTIHTQAFNHTIGTQKNYHQVYKDSSKRFITYAIEWYEDRIDFFADEDKVFTFSNSGNGSAEWPFDKPFYLILNVAVGGGWGGQEGIDDKIFPQRMEVDFVRYLVRK